MSNILWNGADEPPGLRLWHPLDESMREMLLAKPPGEAFIRAEPDESRGGLPAVVIEVCWIDDADKATPVGFRRTKMAGIALGEADGVDERKLVLDEAVAVSDIQKVQSKFSAEVPSENRGIVTLKDGTVYDNLPFMVAVRLLAE